MFIEKNLFYYHVCCKLEWLKLSQGLTRVNHESRAIPKFRKVGKTGNKYLVDMRLLPEPGSWVVSFGYFNADRVISVENLTCLYYMVHWDCTEMDRKTHNLGKINKLKTGGSAL